MTHENVSTNKCSRNTGIPRCFGKIYIVYSSHLFLLQKVQLLVTVIDYDRVGGNEPIGQVLLGADQKGCRRTRSMVASPDFPLNMYNNLTRTFHIERRAKRDLV